MLCVCVGDVMDVVFSVCIVRRGAVGARVWGVWVFRHADVVCLCLGAPLHSASRLPTSTGAVHRSVTLNCVFILVQLNRCVVCGSVLQRGIVVMSVLSSSILFKYECR